jgi:threonine aldolase
MRQAGILAAAGIVALETMVDRLRDDHARARTLAGRLGRMSGLVIDKGGPATNMVFVTLADSVPFSAREAAEKLKSHGILVGVVGTRQFRLVLHYEVDDAGVEQAAAAFKDVIR